MATTAQKSSTTTRKPRKRTVAKPAATTPTVKPAAAKKETAAKKSTVKRVTKVVSRDQDSVTVTMQRGRRDRTTREIVAHEPTGNGGVRFEEIADLGRSPVYLTQDDDTALGSPQKIRVTIKAL